MALTRERLKEMLRYEPDTGTWIWLIDRGGYGRAGTEAGTIRRGYRVIIVDWRPHRSARLAFLYMTGKFPEGFVDHRDGNKNNDQWTNLRLASKSLNGANRGPTKANKSGYKGVSWSSRDKKWQAHIMISGKSIGLGYFNRKDNAALAYNFAAYEIFGDFARYN